MRYPKVPRYRDLVLHPFRRERVQALEDVSFTVPEGELFGFLGPNGAGKTTLIKILTTLILPSSGRARVGGADVLREPKIVKSRIGVVMSDERSFYWRLTGRQNLEFFATLHGLHGQAAARRIDELLDMLGMSEKAAARFSDYSSGMKQKFAIARGLLAEPSILFFDEPTRSLDPISASQVRSFVRDRLVRGLGKTVFLTTHNLYEAEEISDRVGIINRGRLLAVGTVPQISARLRSRERFRLRVLEAPEGLLTTVRHVAGVFRAEHAVEISERGESIDLVVSMAETTIPDLLAAVMSQGARVLECARRESSLIDIFSELITEDARRADPS